MNKKSPYRLLALDLDGTLTNSQKEISTRNKETLLQLQKDGVRVILASGRPTYGIAPLADELEISEYGGFILSYNGGEIIDWKSKEIIFKNILPNEVLPTLYEASKDYKLPILSYDQQEIITEYPQDIYVKKEAFLNKMAVRKVDNFLKALPPIVPKCLIVGEPEKLQKVEQELSSLLGEKISVYRSEPYFLELVPLGIDKAQSLSQLLAHLKMSKEQLVAMGDGYNDLSMIQLAGMGVAMENAQEVLKQAAQMVTLSNDQDGVSEAIQSIFY